MHYLLTDEEFHSYVPRAWYDEKSEHLTAALNKEVWYKIKIHDLEQEILRLQAITPGKKPKRRTP